MGQGRRGGGHRLSGGEAERGPGGDVAEVGRDGGRGRAGLAAAAIAGQHDAAAGEGTAELLAGAGQAAAERPGRASEAAGRFVERQALEVAEDDRRAEGIRQAVDLAVQSLGLVAVDQGLFGRRGSRLEGGVGHGVPLFVLMLAGDAGPGLGAVRSAHAIQPGGEPVGVAEGVGLAGQDEEGGLEGVLGEVAVGEELPAEAQDHRAVPGHQRGEGGLGVGLVAAVAEAFDELAIGERGGGAAVEQRAELPDDRGCSQMGHARGLSGGLCCSRPPGEFPPGGG